MTEHLSINDCIADVFNPAHHVIKRADATHIWCHGGRGSTKSSFIAIQMVLGILRDERANGVCIRKVAKTLRISVFSQIKWAIDLLDVGHEFHTTVSPMEITYRPTGQKILFLGADDKDKMKSAIAAQGYFKLVWFEELDQFHGMPEIRSILQTFMRGGDVFSVFYSYNPPRSRDSWVNREVLHERDDRYVHESNYLDVPRAWLGEQFFNEAEQLEAENEKAYRHEYMGDITGTGGAIFDNVTIRPITDKDVADFDRTYNGVDWGYFPDPWAFNRMHYDKARRKLYVFDEAGGLKMKNRESASLVKKHLGEVLKGDKVEKAARRELVVCDSAEPKSISDYREMGIDARAARKGQGSVEYGVKWLQSLVEIVIDPKRCPVTAEEFVLYEHETTRDGEYCSGYPDKNNHHIDVVRYAMSPVSLRRFSA